MLQKQSTYSFQTNQCELSFGCFRQPQGCIDDCQLLITYVLAKNMSGYVDVTMTTTTEWIALGHNRISQMVGTEAATRRYSSKWFFLKFCQVSRKTLVLESLFNKVAGLKLYLKKALTQVFSREI